jgi:hypothetical protein
VLRSTKGLLFVGVLCCYNLGGPKTSSYVTVGVRRGGGVMMCASGSIVTVAANALSHLLGKRALPPAGSAWGLSVQQVLMPRNHTKGSTDC